MPSSATLSQTWLRFVSRENLTLRVELKSFQGHSLSDHSARTNCVDAIAFASRALAKGNTIRSAEGAKYNSLGQRPRSRIPVEMEALKARDNLKG